MRMFHSSVFRPLTGIIETNLQNGGWGELAVERRDP